MALLASIVKFLLKASLFLLLAVFAVRGVEALRGPTLQPWHTQAPDDATASEIATMDWPAWMRREAMVFAQMQAEVTDQLPPEAQVRSNRYWAKSPLNPANLPTDWNRSYILEPAGPPQGAIVLLHGLTDSPYSLRHIAKHYQARGFVAVGLRIPGHGTVPAGLTRAEVADWEAATSLAVREASRRAPGKPLHIAGYSNGGALALTYALAAGTDQSLPRPSQIILLSPMIGLTPFARFAGLAGWPAIIPAFSNAAWLGIEPEYNPFKYNSFPVKAAAQSHALTVKLGKDIATAKANGSLARFPPVLAFQSAVDSTVSARAVVTGLFDQLPQNGSELVLADVNRAATVGLVLRPSARNALQGLLSPAPRRYRTTIIANAATETAQPTDAAVARITEPGSTTEQSLPLAIPYRRDIFSLGHIAIPFPLTDGLYGLTPDPADPQGITLGAITTRGEIGQLAASMEVINRISSNPFFPLLIERIDSALPKDPARNPE